MQPIIVEGMLADVDGVRHGQLRIEDGVIVAVGPGLGMPDHVFGENCLIFAGMGDIHIHDRQDATGRDDYKETFATASAAALHGGVVQVGVDDGIEPAQLIGVEAIARCVVEIHEINAVDDPVVVRRRAIAGRRRDSTDIAQALCVQFGPVQ